jgi:hypothetical protein
MNREWWKRDVCCGLTVMAMADPATVVVMVVTLLEDKCRSSTDLQVEDLIFNRSSTGISLDEEEED